MSPQHHALVCEAQPEEGIQRAHVWIQHELGMSILQNPDIVTLQFSVLTVADARRIASIALGAPLGGGSKVVIIAAGRAYHEAQNALLKLFEEPPPHTYLLLILPSLGGLLPTLRSRVQRLPGDLSREESFAISQEAKAFLGASREKRSVLIKKLTSGKDDEARRENRDATLLLLRDIEAVLVRQGLREHAETLSEIATFRTHLYDRSAPVRMILEHLSLVIPPQML